MTSQKILNNDYQQNVVTALNSAWEIEQVVNEAWDDFREFTPEELTLMRKRLLMLSQSLDWIEAFK